MRRSWFLLVPLLCVSCGDEAAVEEVATPGTVADAQAEDDAEALAPEAGPEAGPEIDASPDVFEDAEPAEASSEDVSVEDVSELDAADEPEASVEEDGGGEPDAGPTTCAFDYDMMFTYSAAMPSGVVHGLEGEAPLGAGPDLIAHAEPPPKGTFKLPLGREWPVENLTMPNYDDNMPLFGRAADWDEPTRCYERPDGVKFLTEPEAYDMYRAIAELTTGESIDARDEVRTVVGLRGAYPGTFAWHGNLPNRFNDTIVLMWTENGVKRVKEFPVNTDTGAYNFGANSSSSLRANRRYDYVNGWHRTYNALRIDESGYRVRDDTNHNGHWDSDRNGWLPPDSGDDHERTGSGHNIHMGSMNAPLGSAVVHNWSAGCQVIPGMANWTEFITNAWTGEGKAVSYFLIDVRDIAPEVWAPCTPDGTHACPYRIGALPFTDTRDTSQVSTSEFDVYNCSSANEGGPEVVYVMTTNRSGTLSVSVDCTEPVDIDVHLLDGDDANACLARGHKSFTKDIGPGRYFIVADTFVDGQPLSGSYTLRVSWQ